MRILTGRRGFNGTMNKYWDYLNRGVSLPFAITNPLGHPAMTTLLTFLLQRQWKDIRAKYVEGGDDEE